MINLLDKLYDAYQKAPEIFHVSRYWRAYEQKILNEVKTADIQELRSGKYPLFSTFGFNDLVYNYHPTMPAYVREARKLVRKLFIDNRASLPYSLRLEDIREMAYTHCLLQGKLSNAGSIADIEASEFGNPQDVFLFYNKKYTMSFLNFYLRYCFAQQFINLKGDEIIVELGSGSGYQSEILKKIYPNLTILCFDLPAQLYLCEQYLTGVFGKQQVVSSADNLGLESLANIEKGKIHFFGNWQMPLLKEFSFDVFWNAASFGEMEPEIVANYLSYIKDDAEWIYLLQARNGKESTSSSGVAQPIRFNDYQDMLNSSHRLVREEDAYEANRRMTKTGGYFQAVWKKTKTGS